MAALTVVATAFPVLPYMLTTGTAALIASIVISGLALFGSLLGTVVG